MAGARIMNPPVPLLSLLLQWQQAGWLRPLDVALARFIERQDPEAPDSLLLAAALTAHVDGLGHTALELAALLQDPAGTLGWPAEAAVGLRRCLDTWGRGPLGGAGHGLNPADGVANRLVALGQTWAASCCVEVCNRGPAQTVQAPAAHGSVRGPLVLSGTRLALRRYWEQESRVAAQLLARCRGSQAHTEPPTAHESATAERARALLLRLFEAQGPQPDWQPDWQQAACALALRSGLTLVTGGPGTGKTYTAARLLVLLQAMHPGPDLLRVALAAPTGKAAARLRQSIQQALQNLPPDLAAELNIPAWAASLGAARTIHGLLGVQPRSRRPRHHAGHPLPWDVVFVDEASMINLELMDALLDALPPQARLILLGDKDQLASVEAGSVLGDICRVAAGPTGAYTPQTAAWIRAYSGQLIPSTALAALAEPPPHPLAQQTIELRHSRRFDGLIGELALAVHAGRAESVLSAVQDAGILSPDLSSVPAWSQGRHDALAGGYRSYLDLLAQAHSGATMPLDTNGAAQVLHAFERFRVLCALRDGPCGVSGLNEMIESALREAGLLREEGPWYEGRPIIVTRNDPALGLFNGDIGVVMREPDGQGGLRACFLEAHGIRAVAVSRLPPVETAFAMTVHKSQGSEFEHVVLVLPEGDAAVLTREWLYTGITRARKALNIVARDASLLRLATLRLTHRMGGLREHLGAPG